MTIRGKTNRVVLSLCCLALVASCSNQNSDEPTSLELPSTEPAEAAAPTAQPTPELNGPQLNDRGNLVKALGEEGSVVNPDGTPVLTFAIDSIRPAVCDSDYATPAENGVLLEIAMRVTTAPGSDLQPYWTVSGNDFRFIGGDGLTDGDIVTMATYSCMDDQSAGGSFTSDPLGPGQMYAGTVIVDTTAPTGTLIFYPSFGQAGGWEVAF